METASQSEGSISSHLYRDQLLSCDWEEGLLFPVALKSQTQTHPCFLCLRFIAKEKSVEKAVW